MPLKGLVTVAVSVSLLLIPEAVAGQTPIGDLQGGAWGGLYLPDDEQLYNLREAADGGTFAQEYSVAAIQDGGWILGASAGIRPGDWPVRVRFSLAQARGAEVLIGGGTAGNEDESFCLFPPGCVAGAVWSSNLTVSVAQVDVVARPLGNIGPMIPTIVMGVSAQHKSYSHPEVEKLRGSPTTEDTAGTRFPEDELGGALHLGPEVAMNVQGVTAYLRIGDYLSLDARTASDGTADPYLRHDLYLVLGATLN